MVVLPMSIAPGSRLGPYEIVSRIGAGGMGEVWRGRDTRIGREVAVKILPPAFAADHDRLHRFEQEARAAGTLNHPNLITIHDLGTDNGAPYVVMELLEGETLREKIELDGAAVRLPLRKALDYSVQIATGLAAAHEKGIIHRDLKPENIFITRDGRAKILDFGLAKLTAPSDDRSSDVRTQQQNTSPGTVLGTAGYMSPEQVRGQRVDHRSDIFSFGTILYEMLAGRRAFKRDSSVETMNAILKEEPPELSESGVNVPPMIDVMVRHCLEKNPEERFQSARDLAFDLQRISAASGSSPAISTRRSRTRWAASAIAAAVVVVAVFVWRAGHRATASVEAAPATRTFMLLTNQAGVEEFPSLAADGKTFVFVGGKSGNADIYLQRVDGRNAINLTKDSPADDTQPAFSPDGSQIAFRSEREGGGIFLMGATGESVRRVTDFGFNPTWSPDGSEIAVCTVPIELTPQSRPNKSAIDVVHVRTGARRQLVNYAHDGVHPSWSPHGDRIAFWGIVGASGQRDLYSVDPHAADATSAITRLTNDAALDWNPIWSPDGKHLYFGSDRDGTLNLWRMPMDERSGKALGSPEPVSLPTRFGAHFTFARHAGALAYTAVDLSETLWRVAFDPVSLRISGQPSPIFGGAMLLLQAGAVSPDGKWIAFSNIGTQEDIFVARTDGGELRQLTNDLEKDRGPSWSLDGKLLYFYSQRGSRYEIWSIGFDGSGLRQISRTQGLSMWWPKVMRDGRTMYEFNGAGTYLLPLNADGTATRVQALPPMPEPQKNFFLWPKLSPDGTRFIGATGEALGVNAGGSIWLYSIGSKSYEQVTDRGTVPQWLPDGNHVVFLFGTQLAVVDLHTKRVRPIATPRPIRGFAVSHDGRALYLDERTAEADIWMMTPR